MNIYNKKAIFMSNCQMQEYVNNDETFFNRIKYVFPNYSDQDYICVFHKNIIVGSLVMGINSEGENVIYGISVDHKYRNQGIAKAMIDEFFSYSHMQKIHVSVSSYTEDGEKYLKKYIENKQNDYILNDCNLFKI